jgi:hypothetical protein
MQIAPSSTNTWEEDAVKDRAVREKIKADLLDDCVEYTREEEDAIANGLFSLLPARLAAPLLHADQGV